MGLDFLSANKCTVDLERRQLEVAEKWLALTVKEKKNSQDPIQHSKVQIQSTIKVPAFSEMEIMVNTIEKVTEGTWIVEGCMTPKSQILVSCAVVCPGSAGFPMRVMNPTGEEITVYKGHVVANLNCILDSAVATVSKQNESNPSRIGKQELQKIVKGCHQAGMTEEYQRRFFTSIQIFSPQRTMIWVVLQS